MINETRPGLERQLKMKCNFTILSNLKCFTFGRSHIAQEKKFKFTWSFTTKRSEQASERDTPKWSDRIVRCFITLCSKQNMEFPLASTENAFQYKRFDAWQIAWKIYQHSQYKIHKNLCVHGGPRVCTAYTHILYISLRLLFLFSFRHSFSLLFK